MTLSCSAGQRPKDRDLSLNNMANGETRSTNTGGFVIISFLLGVAGGCSSSAWYCHPGCQLTYRILRLH